MSESSYQFLTEVVKASDVSGSIANAYPFVYQVYFGLEGSNIINVVEYYALDYKMSEQVEKRWRYDFKNTEAYVFSISLKGYNSILSRRDIN